MGATRVVNLDLEDYDVYIGRAGHGLNGYFGNPFRIRPGASREQSIEAYRTWFLDRVNRDPEFRGRVEALKGKVLGCFCKPFPCHGDVIVEWLEAEEVVP